MAEKLSNGNLRQYREQSKEVSWGSFERAGNRSMPEGFRATGISVVSDTKIDDLTKGGT